MHDIELVYSRPAATAAQLGEAAVDQHRFLGKRVLLTGEQDALATVNGRECFLNSLRLLIRICRNVDIAFPNGCDELMHVARQTADRLAFGGDVRVLSGPADLAAYDAILSIGHQARSGLPWTVINANGWLARVSSGGTDLPNAHGIANPISALAAASLGSSEVFKRLLHLKPERGKLLDGMAFSLFTFGASEVDPGPRLPAQLVIAPVVVGAGAIGNGIVAALSQLPIFGRVTIVDRQMFGPENLGTSLLLGPDDVGKPKALVAASALRGAGLNARGYHEDVATFGARLGSELPHPCIVLTGLDNVEVRHAVQDLWPDVVIDGAIGNFGCQVSLHPWGEDVACLRCLFRQPAGESAERVASRITGLHAVRLGSAEELLTEEDVLAAPSDKQRWLRERVGRPICSIVQEGVAQALSAEQQRDEFSPSVPFVACLSACMVVSEMVKVAAGWSTPLEPRFQFDVLRGPAFGQFYPQGRRADCLCVTRRRNIDTWRQTRSAA